MSRKAWAMALGVIAVVAIAAETTPRRIDCAVRDTLAADTTLSAGAGLLSSCSASGVRRVEVRIIGATDETDCFCVSPDAGTNWVTVDGEQPVWSSTYSSIADPVKIANGGTDCEVCDEGTGRSFEVVLY